MPKQQLKDAIEERDKAAELSVLASSKGGKTLIKALVKGILVDVEKFANLYSTGTIQEFCALGANINAQLSMLKLLTKSERTKKLIDKEVQALLEEELLDEELPD